MKEIEEVIVKEVYDWFNIFVDHQTIRWNKQGDYVLFQYISNEGISHLKVKAYLLPETLDAIEREFKIKLKFI